MDFLKGAREISMLLRKPLSVLLFGYLVGFIVSTYIIQVFVYNLPFIAVSFWVLKRSLPLTLLCVCQWKRFNVRLKFPFLIAMIALIVGLSMLYLMDKNAFRGIWNFRWSYHASMEYSVFAILYFLGFSNRLRSDLEGLTLTVMLLNFVGLMYELPYYRESLFHPAFCFFINDRILLGLIVIYKMGTQAFRNMVVLVSFGFWLVFSVFIALFPYVLFIPFVALTVRIPTLIFRIVPILKMRGLE